MPTRLSGFPLTTLISTYPVPNSCNNISSYRLQSRKILALIKESLPAELQKVEKASIDEVVSIPQDYVLIHP